MPLELRLYARESFKGPFHFVCVLGNWKSDFGVASDEFRVITF